MKPIANWSPDECRGLVGVFTDIDDTLTTKGAITPDALQALADLKAAGLMVIPITGRPIGWCASFANGNPGEDMPPWPVDAIVAENGGVAFAPDDLYKTGLQPSYYKRKPLLKIYQQPETLRIENVTKMQQVAEQVLREVPQARLSQDGGGRETDLAFDYNEQIHLTPDAVHQVLAILRDAGMHTSVSSIHIHGCFGDFNKWQGACWLVQTLLGRQLPQELDRWVFVGDSGNDQAMFQHFKHSIGVANIRRCAASLSHLPCYVTQAERGGGFAEVARAILEARRTTPVT
jgi:HAD superfamily hydrolase (TIGR01484 family)